MEGHKAHLTVPWNVTSIKCFSPSCSFGCDGYNGYILELLQLGHLEMPSGVRIHGKYSVWVTLVFKYGWRKHVMTIGFY